MRIVPREPGIVGIGGTTMDALTLLKQDHRTVEELFRRFEGASEKALKMKRKIVDQVVVELSKHASIEEALFYPAAREALGEEGKDEILEALEEHHIVKWVCEELRTMPPDAERFCAKMTVLMENVRHHVKEEEQELFPLLRKKMAAAQLKELGARMEKAKKTAPTRPHPRAPDQPPGNLVATPVASVVDRGVDMLKSLAGAAKVRATKKQPRGNGKALH